MTNKCASSSSVCSSYPATAQVNNDLTTSRPASVMHSCPSKLLKISTDPNSYCAMVADACQFNRVLSRGRVSRLPFLDLATQTSQRPAPWLYRPFCERSKDLLEGGTHVVLRYMRHRWRLDYQTPVRKRKLAADRLWFTLRTGLTALGIPTDLIPLVTKRAYAIAGLPIPPGLAPHLEAMISKTNASNSQVNGTVVPVSNRIHQPTTMLGPKRASNSEHCNDPANRKTHTTDPEDEEGLMDDGLADPTDGACKQPSVNLIRNRSLDIAATPLASGEDSTLSADNIEMRRGFNAEDAGMSFDAKTDDEMSVQSGNGIKLSSNAESLHYRTKYEAYEVEDESPEPDDEDDDEELDDDVEWVQSRGRRSYNAVSGGRAFGSSKRRRRSLVRRKGNRFSVVGTRLSTRRMTAGSQRPLGGRQKRPTERSMMRTDSAAYQASSTRAPMRGKFASSSSGATRECEPMREDSWDEFAEPGFQPNANFCSLPLKIGDEPTSSMLLDRTLSHTVSYASTSSVSAALLSSGGENVSLIRDPNVSSTRSSPLPDARKSVPDTSCFSRPNVSAGASVPVPGFTPRITMAQLLSSANTTTTTNNPTPGISSFGAQPSPSAPYDFPAANSSERDGVVFKEIHAPSGHLVSAPASVSPAVRPVSGKDYSNPGLLSGSPIMRNADYQSPGVTANPPTPLTGNNRSSPVCVPTTTEPFASPPGATTTVTFFVCEVCASRYRSTAGLRYHYHSQHSGYTPKNPISASASRIVVPVGEERGIGGGLRGGRPRRHKGTNLEGRGSGRGRLKESKDMKGQTRATVSGTSAPKTLGLEEADGFRPISNIHDSLSGPELHASPRTESFTPSFSTHYMPSGPSNPNVTMAPNRAAESSISGGTYPSGRPFVRSSWTDFYPNRSMDEKNDPNFAPSSISGLLACSANQPTSSSGHDIVELTQAPSSTSQQRFNTLQSLAAMESNVGAGPSYHPRSQSYPHPSSSSTASVNSYGPASGWSSSQDPNPSVGAPPDQPYSAFRLSPNQRRFERQRCPDRLNLNPPPNTSSAPTCVYCLGDDRLNPRVRRPEGLLRCYRCGTWGHFSCLQLPSHVIDMAMRYPWQCIECKTCWVCGSPEQEARMAFCGDCDRTFHIDCLPNPLPRVPTTHWSCYLCVHDLYTMPSASTTTIEAQY